VLTNDDFFYVVMDRYHGDLQQFITDHKNTQKPIPKELLISIARQLADALAYVHTPCKVNERGDVLPSIVHRDLKPDNVLMNKDGDRVVIADFGLCKDAQHDERTFAGSSSYMALKIFIHQKTSPASDIWALGVIIYELATLRLPSFSQHWEPEKAKEFFVDGWRPDLSAIEDAFVKMVLEKIFVLDPAKRPTAGDIAILFQTLNTSASEPGAQNSLLDEGHRPYGALDDTNLKVNSSWTPLMRAAAAGDIKAVKRHLSKKGKKDNRKDMALMIAARAGHEDVVELLDPTDKYGVTALMKAVDRNDMEMVELLIPFQKTKIAPGKVKINGRYMCKGTALMRAAAHGYARIVELLVEHEGGVRRVGWPALMLAAQCYLPNHPFADPFVDHPKCVELLMEREGSISKWTELMYATYRGDVDTVRSSLHMKGSRDVGGWTALMYAAAQGHEEIIELLREEGGMMNNDRQTALMWAARNGHPGCVRLLLEKEGGMLDKYGGTALMWAVFQNKPRCAKLLAEREKDIKGARGETALDIPKGLGCTEIVSVPMVSDLFYWH
ncbi:SSU ribosomal protein S8E, partial [Giardia duodenalis]